MGQEVLTGIERRRRWSDAEKRSILLDVGVSGARVADVARRHGLTRQHLYQWRAELRRRGESLVEETNFLPVEIVLANGRRGRGFEGLPSSALTQLIRVLESA